jgi:hypothetical protein
MNPKGYPSIHGLTLSLFPPRRPELFSPSSDPIFLAMSLRALPRTASPSLRLLLAPQVYSTNLRRPTPPARTPSSSTSSLLLRPSLQRPHRRSLSSSPPYLAPPPTPADDGLLPEERRRKRREELMKEEAEKNQRRNAEQTLRLEEILEAGPGNPQYDRIQGDDRALPFPQERQSNRSPFPPSCPPTVVDFPPGSVMYGAP